MQLKTSLTGSYPPKFDPEEGIDDLPPADQESLIRESIQRAVKDQVELGIDYLVDGQIREDIVTLFTRNLPGFDYCSILPCRVVGRIEPMESGLTTGDFAYARGLAMDYPFKAHLTGPMTIARGAEVPAGSYYPNRQDRALVLDLAAALAREARLLVAAGAEVVQIDEPVMADDIDLPLAFEALRIIVEQGEVPTPALHICGNVTRILEKVLTQAPVKIVSLEGSWLMHERLQQINGAYLKKCGKQIGLGCIEVASYAPDSLTRVQNFLDQMVTRLGFESIWAVMPNCGLRPMPYKAALEKLKIMVKAASGLSEQFNRRTR